MVAFYFAISKFDLQKITFHKQPIMLNPPAKNTVKEFMFSAFST